MVLHSTQPIVFFLLVNPCTGLLGVHGPFDRRETNGTSSYSVHCRYPPLLDILNAYLGAELDTPRPYFHGSNACAFVRLLGAIADPSSMSVLDRATKHPNRNVAADAQEALAKIGDAPKTQAPSRSKK